jgi:hypothetical protein
MRLPEGTYYVTLPCGRRQCRTHLMSFPCNFCEYLRKGPIRDRERESVRAERERWEDEDDRIREEEWKAQNAHYSRARGDLERTAKGIKYARCRRARPHGLPLTRSGGLFYGLRRGRDTVKGQGLGTSANL